MYMNVLRLLYMDLMRLSHFHNLRNFQTQNKNVKECLKLEAEKSRSFVYFSLLNVEDLWWNLMRYLHVTSWGHGYIMFTWRRKSIKISFMANYGIGLHVNKNNNNVLWVELFELKASRKLFQELKAWRVRTKFYYI